MPADQSVAVVAADELLIRTIRGVLSADTITISDSAADVAGLGDLAEVSAIVISCCERPMEGRALVRDAVSRFPDIPSVVIGKFSNSGVHKVLGAGAFGFVHASELEATLSATIRGVGTGQVVVPRQLSRVAVRPALSYREKQALALLAKGLTNRQIAARLFLAESTVKTHLTSIFGKLGVHSRSEAAEIALDPEQNIGLIIQGINPPAHAGATSEEAPT